ncbi:TraB/GumN family protein [uncultured Deefgea sp.]|uniref:TraB/GumN family protein n=1 Tax=uncultured Deefgea sp. TaxID=1304914 RepID=UPI002602D09E|nr:TraB/GumN family protein [uncultured Deefgea sp.]
MRIGRWLGLIGLLFLSACLHAECLPAPAPLSVSEQQALQAAAKDQGFLWKISKNGRHSWLYGTIHINHVMGLFPGPKVLQALQSSTILALELNPNDAKTQAELAQLAQAGAGQVPPQLQSRLAAQLAAVCLPARLEQAIHPTLLFASMSVLGLRAQGLEAEYGSEQMLLGLAKTGKQRVVALETPTIQMNALLGPELNVSSEDYEFALQQLEGKADQALALKIVKAWEQSDFSTLTQYAEWCDCLNTPAQEASMRRLMAGRNPALADGIAQWHRQGASVFAAVGSLHMVGRKGLLFLLAQRGFKIERIH